jgi:hypothetical protein
VAQSVVDSLPVPVVKRREAIQPEEDTLEINWRHDIDQVLEDARARQKPVLLDFSAAPM